MTITNTALAQKLDQVATGWQSFATQQINWLISDAATVILVDPVTNAQIEVKTPAQLQRDYAALLGPTGSQLAIIEDMLEDATQLLQDAANAQSLFNGYNTTFTGYLSQANAAVLAAQDARNAAQGHANSASTQATAAAGSATSAATQASNAAGSATAAAGSATTANNRATAAANSATAAANSATAAAGSATAAANSADEAEDWANVAINQRARTWYTGNGNPTVPLPGNPMLLDGDLYLDQTDGEVWKYDGTGTTWNVVADITGPRGFQGFTGPTGEVGINWKGNWGAVNYVERDAVAHNGSSYYCITTHTGSPANEPGVALNWQNFWAVIASAAIGIPDRSINREKINFGAISHEETDFLTVLEDKGGIGGYLWGGDANRNVLARPETEEGWVARSAEQTDGSYEGFALSPVGLAKRSFIAPATVIDFPLIDIDPIGYNGTQLKSFSRLHLLAGELAAALVNANTQLNSSADVYAGAQGMLRFYSNLSGTWANRRSMVFDSSGRLGVGIEAPAYALDVVGEGRFSQTLRLSADIQAVRTSAIANVVGTTETFSLIEGAGNAGRVRNQEIRLATGTSETAFAWETIRETPGGTKRSGMRLGVNELSLWAGATEVLKVTTGGATINSNAVWHAGNDGAGSGLDADFLDGQHASAFALTSHNHDTTYGRLGVSNTWTQQQTVNNRVHAQQFTSGLQALADQSAGTQALSINWTLGQYAQVAFTGNGTTNLAFTHPGGPCVVSIVAIAAATRTFNWPAGVNVYAPSGSAEASYAPPAGVRTVIQLFYNGAGEYYRL